MENKEKTKFIETVCFTHLKGDIVITDPCYLDNGMEEKNENGKYISWNRRVTQANIPSLMGHYTLYGDWGCTVFDVTKTDGITKKSPAIGRFCADAGFVCVCLLEHVLKFNPKFQEFLDKHEWCVTVIKNFDGNILFNKYKYEYEYEGKHYIDYYLQVEGGGQKDGKNFAFIGVQTSL